MRGGGATSSRSGTSRFSAASSISTPTTPAWTRTATPGCPRAAGTPHGPWDEGVQGGSGPAERSGADGAAAFPLADPGRRRRRGEEPEMRSFVFDALPGRVVFGVGCRDRLGEEVGRLGGSRVLLITDPATRPVAEELASGLGERFAALHDEVQQHVPVEAVQRVRDVAEDNGADCVVTVGGGSTTGFGKAIALESGVSTIAVPTTYAGSEMTPIYGIT